MDAPVQVFSCKESSFVPLVLSVRYATDSMLQKNALKSGCNRCKTGALYQSSCSLPYKDGNFDTMRIEVAVFILHTAAVKRSWFQGFLAAFLFSAVCCV